MTGANQQGSKKTGGRDGGIVRQLEALDIKDLAGEGHDSENGDEAGGVARRIKECCDKAVAHLKAGRLGEAYVYANEALELNGKDAKAAALRRYTLCALHPKRRLLDKATALRDEAGQCIEAGNYDKAHELFTLATKWHGDPSILLWAVVNFKLGRFDLAYLDVAEALAAGMKEDYVVELQKSCLRSLGFKMPQVIEPQQQRVDEIPAHFPRINLPNGVRVENLVVELQSGYAKVVNATDLAPLMPPIPLGQLARFLDEQGQSAMGILGFSGGDWRENAMLRLLDDVTRRLHADKLILDDLFHLPMAGIKRILDGRTLRAKETHFHRLQLPSGVDPNELLKLPTIRDCTVLSLQLYTRTRPQLPGRPPLFKNAALVEWVKWSADERTLTLTREYLSSGLLGFLDALKKDFQQATRAHSYAVTILCPNFDVADGLGVRNKLLFNQLGEMMVIMVREDPAAAVAMGHRFEAVSLVRLPRT